MAKQKLWRAEQVPTAIRTGQLEASKTTRPFQDARRFVEDFFPRVAARMEACSRSFEVQEDQLRPGFVKLNPRRCHQVPYCIICSLVAGRRRASVTLSKLAECTPAGQKPRFRHIVQTAPLTREGEGWGLQASRNRAGFGRVVMGALEERFGKGIGVVASYQDFGEEGFKKTHPHLDMTLNGWMLQDGEPVRTPYMELKGDGRDAFDELVVKHAQTLAIGARRGNVKFDAEVVGERAYYRVIKYQMRELVDLRKLVYKRGVDRVGWKDYKRNRVTSLPVKVFLDRFFEYQERLGHWHGGPGGQELHVGYGHASKRLVRSTVKAMGGVKRPHDRMCVCAACGDWAEYELTEEEEKMNRVFMGTWPEPRRSSGI